MDILPFSLISVVSLFFSGCLYLFVILVLHLACNCLRRDCCLVIACPRLRSVFLTETLRHEISSSNRWGWHWKGWAADANWYQLFYLHKSWKLLQHIESSSDWYKPLRTNWSLWGLGNPNFTSACSGESWNSFLFLLGMVNSTKWKRKDQTHR